MIDFASFADLATTDLGEWADKPTSIDGNQVERSADLSVSADGRVTIGVWECSIGRFSADRSASSEFCYFLAGEIEMTRQDGEVIRLKAGDSIYLPLGWKGIWRILAPVRKIYVITQGA